jgi:hypothetical protein
LLSAPTLINAIDGLAHLNSATSFLIKQVVGDDPTGSEYVLGGEQRLDSGSPLLVLAVDEDEAAQ